MKLLLIRTSKSPFCINKKRLHLVIVLLYLSIRHYACWNWHSTVVSLLPRFQRASPSTSLDKKYHYLFVSLVNFIIRIYSQSDTICSFVEASLTPYSIESSDFGNYEIHSV